MPPSGTRSSASCHGRARHRDALKGIHVLTTRVAARAAWLVLPAPGVTLADSLAAGEARQLFSLAVALTLLVLALSVALLRRSRQLKISRTALSAALARRNPVLAALPDLVWVKDPDGTYVSCNATFARLFATSEAAVVGKTDFDFLDTDQARRWRKLDRLSVDAGEAGHTEEWVTFANDGHCALLRVSRVPMYDDDGRLFGVLCIGRNITGEHKAQTELRQRESYQRALLNNFPFRVWLKDTEGRFLAVNERFAELSGISDARQLVGQDDTDVFAPDVANAYRAADRSVMATRRQQEVIERQELGDGEQWLETYRAAVCDDEGKLLGTVGFSRDVTERREIELALRNSEARFRRFFEEHSSVMLMVDPESGEIVAANQAAHVFYGFRGDSLVGMPITRINQLSAGEVAEARRQALARETNHFRFRHRLANEETRDVEVYSTPVESGGRSVLFSVIHDVTERVRAEAALAAERDLFSAGPVVVFRWIPEGGWPVQWVSSNVEAVLGYAPHELVAADRRFHELVHPDDIDRVRRHTERCIRTGIDRFELSYRLLHKHSGYTWFHDFTRVARDADGQVEGISGYLFDQTELKALELSLADQRNRLAYVIEGTHVGTWEWNIETGEARFNERWADIVGYTLAELAPVSIETWNSLAHPDDLKRSAQMLHRHFTGELPYYEFEARMRHKDGYWVWVLDRGRVFEWSEDGRPLWMAGTHQEITERRQAAETLRLAGTVFAHAHEAIMVTDASGTIIDVNAAFTAITGYSHTEAVGNTPRILKSGRHDRAFYQAMWQQLEAHGCWKGEIWNRRKNGELYAEMLSISTVLDAQGGVQNRVALFSDITTLKEHQEQLESIAFYDPLTGLPNRVLLGDRLHQAIAHAGRHRTSLAVVYLDLDGFKRINDAHGHEAGDRLLVDISTRLKQVLRDEDTVARLGGDEFVAVLVDLPDPTACIDLLPRLLAAASQPSRLNGTMLQVTASLGVTLYPQADDVDPDQLLRQADQAMYQAKLAGKNRYHLFDTEQDRSIRGQAELLEQMRTGLTANEFVLHYQPRVNMRTGEVLGVEALVRWPLPQGGLRQPAEFLPHLENHPLAVALDTWVIERALSQAAAWRASGIAIGVSVNVSAYTLQQPDFVERLEAMLSRHPTVKPADLVIEVLETTAMMDMAGVSGVIRAAQGLGVTFALDDFGTGYSSLNYLKNLPARQIKIDRGFVHDMLDDRDDLAIIEAILGLAAAFSREPVAEGVETAAHGELLLLLGCECAQGYAIARPMPAEALPGWMASWRPYPSWGIVHPIERDDLPVLFAIVEHRAWLKALEGLLGDRGAAPPMDAGACNLGRWLAGEGGQRFAGHPALGDCIRVHRKMHAFAEQLVAMGGQGRSGQALARMPELHALSDDLVMQLKRLLRRSECGAAIRLISS